LHLAKLGDLRYGENPHQAAAVYAQSEATAATLVRAEKLHGKELSYNNLLDLDSALSAVRDWPAPCVVVIKHNNPCGAATDGVLSVATRKALDGDPTSAFGSVLGFNRPLDAATAEVLAEPGRFVEAIVAPDYDAAAIAVLTTRPAWKNSVRLLRLKPMGASAAAWQCRPVDGGFLVQEPDIELPDETKWHVATALRPAEGLWPDLRFAWRMVRYAKSNAIVVAREGSLIGVGAGQMSRVDSVKIALEKAGGRARGSVLASDAFFPFADSIELAAASGIAAIIQPGGSKRDAEVIEACNRHKLAMIFTGTRHFRH
jgi:phosphoribosylaminoimidazolecarboxamide formyltransferase/IMP cyclohydrolase